MNNQNSKKLILRALDEYLSKELNSNAHRRLLLHCCCGPCSTSVVDLLNKYFDVTLYFSNSNMDSLDEFNLRYQNAKIVSDKYNIPIIMDDYTPESYYEKVAGLEHLGEKSLRCYECYKMRMVRTAEFAKNNDYDLFTTTISVSPHKLSDWINEIGEELAKKYDIEFLYSNFKLRDGYKKSIIISKELELYRQEYCGCVYSKQERGGSDE